MSEKKNENISNEKTTASQGFFEASSDEMTKGFTTKTG